MKIRCFVFCSAVFFFSVVSGQNGIVPKTGEGRHDRNPTTVFWPNDMFTMPSVFISGEEINVRPMRKWWRDPVRPVPSLPNLRSDPAKEIVLPGARPANPTAPPLQMLFSDPFPGKPKTTDVTYRLIGSDRTDRCLLTRQILNHLNRSTKDSPLLPGSTRMSPKFRSR